MKHVEFLHMEFETNYVNVILENIEEIKKCISESPFQESLIGRKKNPPMKWDIIFKIVKKNMQKNVSYISIFGIPNEVFLVSSKFLILQNYNTCFHAKEILFDKDYLFFYLDEETKIKTIFSSDPLIECKSFNVIGNHHDPYYNVDASVIMDNHVSFPERFPQLSIKDMFRYLKGVVIKIERQESRNDSTPPLLILKLIDSKNMIDSIKVWLKFDHLQRYQQIGEAIQMHTCVSFRNGITQAVDKKGRISFYVTCSNQVKIKIKQLDPIMKNLFPASISERIKMNTLNCPIIVNELVNFHSYYIHRGLTCLIVRILKVSYIKVLYLCRNCDRKYNSCECKNPILEYEVLAFLNALSSDIKFTCKITNWKCFEILFELTELEKTYFKTFLQQNEMFEVRGFVPLNTIPLSFKQVLRATSEKLLADKMIFGAFELYDPSSKDRNQTLPEDTKVFLNGSLKKNQFTVKHMHIFQFKIKHINENNQEVIRKKEKMLLAKLLI